MHARKRGARAKKTARERISSSGRVVSALLKAVGTLLLIFLTSCIIFTCIFVLYVKANFSSGIDLRLDDFKLSLSSTIYCKDRNTGEFKELVTLQSSKYRKWVDYEDIPAYMEYALVAIEDKRFYEHHGVDWYRTFGAFVNMFLGMRDNFGGSTITQQLIKNLTGDSEATVQRKLLEIFRALEFERQYDKKQIIEWYLNVVNFGGNRYGVGAAAEYYFGKNVSDLSLAECASIIAITNNPSKYNPYIDREQNKQRQENILSEMYSQGYISKEEMESAKAQQLVFRRGENEQPPKVVYTWFEDAVIEDVISDLMAIKGCSRDTAEDLLFTGGYKIYSTLDPDIQAKVDSVYKDVSALPKVTGSKQQVQSAMVIVDPKTGEIVAMSGGVGEKAANRILNRATQTTRPPGSSIKPLSVYAPAIEYGLITPDTRFKDTEDVRLSGTTWMPKNDDLEYHGVVTVREAVRRSLNTVAAQIVDKLTPKRSYNFLTNILGFTTLSPYDADYAPMALGQLTHGVTVREMASAYTMFVNGGIEMRAVTYTKLFDSKGNLVYENKPKQTAAISEVTAYWVTDLLRTAATSGTGSEANLGSLMPTAGKTGTSTDKKDRWFAGFTPYYVGVVWTGYDKPATMRVIGNPSAQIWKKVMKLVHEGLPYKEFPEPANTYLQPVPGVEEEVKYTIRGVTVDGEVLYETSGTKMKGTELTAAASEVDGYRLVGSSEKTITLTDDPSENVIEFYYQSVLTPSPSAPPSSPPSESPPSGEPSPSPPPSGEPSASPEGEGAGGLFPGLRWP